jgi:hypothetical protein
VDDPFWDLLAADARSLPGSPSPFDLAAIMLAESGIDHGAVGKNANGSRDLGINQINTINWHTFGIDDPDAYLALEASAQWARVVRPFYERELRAHPEAAKSARDLYWLNFAPGRYTPGAPDTFEISPGVRPLADADGIVRAGSLVRFLERAQKANAARWSAVREAIADALHFVDGPEEPDGGHLLAGAVAIGVAGGLVALALKSKRGR